MAKTETQNTEFIYVDMMHRMKNGKNSAWSRVKVDEISKYQQEIAANYSCFATIQRFANPVRNKGEAVITPLFFDFDGELATAHGDTKKVIEFLTKELDAQITDIQIFFSGGKGFHVIVHPTAVGIFARTDTHKIMKHACGYLKYRLNLETLDMVVYTDSRMLRRPNSTHEKSKLYKIELSYDELNQLTIEEIKDLAKQPRTEPVYPAGTEIVTRPKLSHFYNDKLKEYVETAAVASPRTANTEYHFVKGRHPACVQDILDGGWKKDGDRNLATVQLCAYFKEAGYTKEAALEILEEWVTRHTSAKGGYQTEQRLANTRSVVAVIYSKENEYRFGCQFIRSLHGDKSKHSKDYERVKCAGDMCPCLHNTVEEKDAVELTLDQTGNAEYTGKLVKTRVMVVGVRATPYIVPKTIEYHCWGSNSCKKLHCPLHDIPSHIGYKNLGCYSREILQMTGVSDEAVRNILAAISGIPSCAKYHTEVTEQANVLELAVIPKADETEDGGNKYVLRKIYLVRDSNNGVRVDENKYYEITGYVYPHPKNQESTIMVSAVKPLQDMVEMFTVTKEVKEQLKVFQCNPDFDSISAKVESLVTDVTYNVTQIVEREEPTLGVMLVQHSLLRLNVPWDTDPIRGWLELMILGDTGTGKSALVNKMVKFGGLGDVVNAESTSRTGLAYKMEQAGQGGAWYIVWGAFPRADKGFLWIDECTGISKDEYGQLTMARSDGKLQVKKAVTSETNCRVRAVISGNVTKGKRISDFTYGCKALKEIYNNEDIRRFDFAIGMKMEDVDSDIYNRLLGTYPKSITNEAYRNNMLFAWSRTAEQVKWAPGATETVLKAANALSKDYGNITDVPLVSPSDMRAKVARMSAALATLLHSVDASGEAVLVHPAHVEYVHEYMQGIYRTDGLGMAKYAAVCQGDQKLSQEKFEKLTAKIKQVPTLQSEKTFKEFLKLFSKQDYFRVSEIEALLSIDKEEAKSIVNMLAKNDFIKSTSGGLKKEPRFNAYINKCYDAGLLSYLRQDDD